MRVVTCAEMLAVEEKAISCIGVPALVLMENAARAVADAIAERYPDARRIAIACGRGSNGGDGLALQRILAARGLDAEAFVSGDLERLGVGARHQFECGRRLGLPIRTVTAPHSDDQVNRRHDLWVDALLGTGLRSAVHGSVARWVGWFDLNRGRAPVVSLDLPTGVDGSTPVPPGPHVVADLTVALGFPKVANVLPPSADAGGELLTADLGVPLPEPTSGPDALHLVQHGELVGVLPQRSRSAHKGHFGHVVVAGGSLGYSGAVILATRAAVRSGAGLVTAAVPEPLLPVLEASSLESMTLGLPDTSGGWSKAAADALLDAIHRRASPGALALGPGLGTSDEARHLARKVVARCTAPTVLDADGISAFAGDALTLRARDADLVITPHVGELSRLLAVSTAAVAEKPLDHVRRAAALTGAVVVLKGRGTLISDPALGTWINRTGNPGMASGGSGDVLAGMIAALLAQGLPAPTAARLGVHVHGLAGDLAAEERGEVSMAAGDLLTHLGDAFVSLES